MLLRYIFIKRVVAREGDVVEVCFFMPLYSAATSSFCEEYAAFIK
jgi:hypothetical protein